jgi:hypothetical protein
MQMTTLMGPRTALICALWTQTRLNHNPAVVELTSRILILMVSRIALIGAQMTLQRQFLAVVAVQCPMLTLMGMALQTAMMVAHWIRLRPCLEGVVVVCLMPMLTMMALQIAMTGAQVCLIIVQSMTSLYILLGAHLSLLLGVCTDCAGAHIPMRVA